MDPNVVCLILEILKVNSKIILALVMQEQDKLKEASQSLDHSNEALKAALAAQK